MPLSVFFSIRQSFSVNGFAVYPPRVVAKRNVRVLELWYRYRIDAFTFYDYVRQVKNRERYTLLKIISESRKMVNGIVFNVETTNFYLRFC